MEVLAGRGASVEVRGEAREDVNAQQGGAGEEEGYGTHPLPQAMARGRHALGSGGRRGGLDRGMDGWMDG